MKLIPSIELQDVLSNPLHPFHEIVIWWEDDDGTQGASFCGTYVTRKEAERLLDYILADFWCDDLDDVVRCIHYAERRAIPWKQLSDAEFFRHMSDGCPPPNAA